MHALLQEQRDVLLTADIGGTNCRFSLWQANIKADVVYDEIFTKVQFQWWRSNAACQLRPNMLTSHMFALCGLQLI